MSKAKTKAELEKEVSNLKAQVAALNLELKRKGGSTSTRTADAAPGPHEPDITVQELADMDGAGGFNSSYELYPVPVAKQQELEAAMAVANNGPFHRGNERIGVPVQLSDFNYTAYEEHHKGVAPSGSPQSLAFRHKKTGKSQAGFAYDDPGNPKQLSTAVVLTQLGL